MKEENGTIIDFLCGEKPFDGVWFSEKHPTEKGAFWWRKHLRNYEASRESKSAVPSDLDIHKEAMALYDRIDTVSFKAGAKWAINFKRGITE